MSKGSPWTWNINATGNVLEMQMLGPHLRPSRTETLGTGPSSWLKRCNWKTLPHRNLQIYQTGVSSPDYGWCFPFLPLYSQASFLPHLSKSYPSSEHRPSPSFVIKSLLITLACSCCHLNSNRTFLYHSLNTHWYNRTKRWQRLTAPWQGFH